HFSVITLKRSPSSRRITSRVHSSQARAVRSASGTSGCGRSMGCQARKNASLSVTRSSAPPEIRRTASPRQTSVSENVSPSTSIPSQRSTSPRASSASRSGAGQPVEVRRVGSLVPCSPAEHLVRAVGEPVEEEDDDGIHRGAEATPRRDVRGLLPPVRDGLAEALEIPRSGLLRRKEGAELVAP